jgi:hypothetical protein
MAYRYSRLRGNLERQIHHMPTMKGMILFGEFLHLERQNDVKKRQQKDCFGVDPY